MNETVNAPSARTSAPTREPKAVTQTVESRMLVERTRWAMRIHDGLTQSVTSAVLELQTLRQRIEADPVEAIASLEAVERAIREDLSDIRAILFELQEGEPPTEQPLGRFVDDLVSRWRLHARVSVEGGDTLETAPARVLETAHAIIAEALANAARHSGSPDVAVRVRPGDRAIRIEVEDRGRGIVEEEDEGDLHFGLRLMRARAEDVGGSIEIGQTPGGGTRVVALLPVGGQEER